MICSTWSGVPMSSASLSGSGGGSSPFIAGTSSFGILILRRCPVASSFGGSKGGEIRCIAGGVTGDFGVLPPDWEVRGDGGGLPSMFSWWGFILRPSAPFVSWVAMLMGEALSDVEHMGGVCRVSNLVQVTMSVLSSEGRRIFPPSM